MYTTDTISLPRGNHYYVLINFGLFCVLKTLVPRKRSTVAGNIFIAKSELVICTITLYTSKCQKSTGATEKKYTPGSWYRPPSMNDSWLFIADSQLFVVDRHNNFDSQWRIIVTPINMTTKNSRCGRWLSRPGGDVTEAAI